METKRKLEEIERRRQEDEDLRAAVALQVIASIQTNDNFKLMLILRLKAQLEREAQEDNQYRQQLEQERRDHELAMRLAQETNGQVEDSPLLMRKYVAFLVHV